MRLPVLMTANAATVADNLLHIQGGAWEHYATPGFPAYIQGFLAGVVELEHHELQSSPTLRVSVADADGHELGSSASMVINGYRPSVLSDNTLRQPFALPFSVMMFAPGPIRIRVEANGEPLGSVDFMVALLQAPSN